MAIEVGTRIGMHRSDFLYYLEGNVGRIYDFELYVYD